VGKNDKINPKKKFSYPYWAILLGSLFLIIWLFGISPSIFEYFGYYKIGKVLRFLNSFICHGIPDRCPVILGNHAAVCYRCTGIDLSFFLGSILVFPLLKLFNYNNLKFFIFLSIAFSFLMAFEWLFEILKTIPHNPMFQLSTGMFFGAAVSILVCILIDKAINYEYK